MDDIRFERRDSPATRCPYCTEEVSAEEARVCAACDTGYHPACWVELGRRCGTLGCRGRAQPSAGRPGRVRITPRPPAPRWRRRLGALVAALVLMALGVGFGLRGSGASPRGAPAPARAAATDRELLVEQLFWAAKYRGVDPARSQAAWEGAVRTALRLGPARPGPEALAELLRGKQRATAALFDWVGHPDWEAQARALEPELQAYADRPLAGWETPSLERLLQEQLVYATLARLEVERETFGNTRPPYLAAWTARAEEAWASIRATVEELARRGVHPAGEPLIEPAVRGALQRLVVPGSRDASRAREVLVRNLTELGLLPGR